MARSWFAGTGNEIPVIQGPKGELIVRAIWPLKIFTAQTGGTQHTGLLLNGNTVDEIPAAVTGYPRFQGPDGVNNWVWGEINGGTRFLLLAQNPGVVADTVAPSSPITGEIWVDTN